MAVLQEKVQRRKGSKNRLGAHMNGGPSLGRLSWTEDKSLERGTKQDVSEQNAVNKRVKFGWQ